MTSLKSSISPTGGGQTSPALSFIDRCTIADRELGFIVERMVAVRDMLARETNPIGADLLKETWQTLGNVLHDLRGRQTLLKNITPVLRAKMKEIA